jgi:hypothetical protein
LLNCTAQAATTLRGAERLRQHLWAALLCPERATLTNLLCTGGLQQQDWSAHYRAYSHRRVDTQVLLDRVSQQVQQALNPSAPLVVAMDDTLVRKCGTHIHGVRWRRDPLGPAFQTNLVRGQRYLQFSAAWPLGQGQARLLPIGFYHVPGAGRPARGADEATLAAHRKQCQQQSLNTQTLGYMRRLRDGVPSQRPIVFTGDGSYTNKAVLCGLPEGTSYIGRMRKDALLHYLPEDRSQGAMGRRPSYGPQAPTPEALRQDQSIAWQKVTVFAAGQRHRMRIKTLGPVLWRKAGAHLPVRIVVIAPLGYRPRQSARVLYRQPAYLLCSDLQMSLTELVQYYLWRWGIEVNFREQKSLVGTGQAQVRSEASNQQLPAMTVAAYALLWAAALSSPKGKAFSSLLKPPKWRTPAKGTPQGPQTTGALIRQLRYEAWAGALRPATFSHFMHAPRAPTNAEKLAPSLPSAILCVA